MDFRPSPPRSSSLRASALAKSAAPSPQPNTPSSAGKLRVRNVDPLPTDPPPFLRSQSAGSPHSAPRSPVHAEAGVPRSRTPSECVLYATPDSYHSPRSPYAEHEDGHRQAPTPTKKGRSRSGSKLLPAIPLRVDVAVASSRGGRLVVAINDRTEEPLPLAGHMGSTGPKHPSPASRQKSNGYVRRTARSRETSNDELYPHAATGATGAESNGGGLVQTSIAEDTTNTPPRPPRRQTRSGTTSSPAAKDARETLAPSRLPQFALPSTPVRYSFNETPRSSRRVNESPSIQSPGRSVHQSQARRKSVQSTLEPPQPVFRSISPSASSISTLSDAPTPRASAQTERRDLAEPLSQSLDRDEDATIVPSSKPASRRMSGPSRSQKGVVSPVPPSSPRTIAPKSPITPITRKESADHEPRTLPQRKRDSTQRRLSALRGLVGQLDLNQPWSVTGERAGSRATLSEREFWAHGGSDVPDIEEIIDSDDAGLQDSASSLSDIGSAISVQPLNRWIDGLRDDSWEGHRDAQAPTHDHGWGVPEPQTEAGTRVETRQNDIRSPQKTPPRRGSSDSIASSLSSLVSFVSPKSRNSATRKGSPTSSVTPPRRSRLRSESSMKRNTPEPPCPPSRARREVFDVASSGYSKSLEAFDADIGMDASPGAPITPWRSNLSSDLVYQQVMHKGGPLEIKRQEIMWELYETEVAFLKSMRTVLRMFATPLKTPHGNWIEGIPARITELFDALDTITHVHGVLATQLRDQRRQTDKVDLGEFIGKLLGWIHKLETHEWYLVRFEQVVGMVEDAIKDRDSVFGEFVRMQSKGEVMGSMGLGSMLLKPVQRLTKYPLFIKRLLDVTTHPHECHAKLLELLALTESTIMGLQATKGREDDFGHLQQLETRCRNIPANVELAVRGRRLLAQAQVVRVPMASDKESPQQQRLNHYRSRSSLSSFASSAVVSNLSSPPWEHNAFSPSTARTSAFSTAPSSASGCAPPSRSTSQVMSPSGVSPASVRHRVERSPSTSSTVDSSRSSVAESTRVAGKKEDVLTMLIFDDLVLVGHVITEKSGLFGGKKKDKVFRVLDEADGGIGKVLDVKDVSGWQDQSGVFTLTVVAPNVDAIMTNSYAVISPAKKFDAEAPGLDSTSQVLAVLSQAVTAPDTEDEATDARSLVDDEAESDVGDVWKAVRALGAAR